MSSPLSTRGGQVFLPVRDMPAAVEWHSRLFGLDVDAGQLGHGDTIFDISDGRAAVPVPGRQPAGLRRLGPARNFFLTDDLAATVEHVRTLELPTCPASRTSAASGR